MSDKRVIGTAAVIAVGVGSVNAVAQDKRLPSAKFLIGSGVTFMILSALSDAEPEIAKAFAIAIATTIVLGDGGGVLAYINTGEVDTAPRGRKGRTPVEAKARPRVLHPDEEERRPVVIGFAGRSTGAVRPAPIPARPDTIIPR